MSPRRLFQSGLLAALFALSVGALTLTPTAALAASSPTITGITPPTGSSLGGTSITISGTDFQPSAAVYIGGILSASARVSATMITATTPPASLTTGGAANVTIINPDGGAVSLSSGFFYTAYQPPLTITAVEASSGPNSGGTNVTITGTNFSPAAAVYFGDVPAGVVNPLGSSAIFARTPANVSGPVTVTVVNADGLRATRANGFTYTGGISVTTVAPGAGALAGGTTITVNGNGFMRGATVKIGDTAATSVLVVNSTQIVAVTPPGVLGTARLVVTNPDGQSGAKEQGFTYGPAAGIAAPVLA
ncbi:MAG: IPT/TIG domain-containing protein, partial [Chloroflexota bacterium]